MPEDADDDDDNDTYTAKSQEESCLALLLLREDDGEVVPGHKLTIIIIRARFLRISFWREISAFQQITFLTNSSKTIKRSEDLLWNIYAQILLSAPGHKPPSLVTN